MSNTYCSVYIAASIDGFIAREDGDIDWLTRPTRPDDEVLENTEGISDTGDFGYEEFISGIDAIVMGRGSFEKVLTFGEWPYEGTPVAVLSSRKLEIPDSLTGKAMHMTGWPDQIVSQLAAKGYRRLYIDGGVTIQRFLTADLIDQITVTWIPVLLGAGIPLFGSLGRELRLKLVDSTAFSNGFVQTSYRVERSGSN